ncbi:hypothetical protein POTOM_029645 [Populus tomentosa]|uniref:Uncharacterized protein n=1 Tax=Populus tomentosa TaxID=118781 RepID=A0A8X7ZAF3_POPTO|nr:hypothetical protein POTOM_029645 [Populus tomentosa]
MGLHRKLPLLHGPPLAVPFPPHLCPVFDFLFNEVEIPFRDISRPINRCPKLGFVDLQKLNYQTTLSLVYNVERRLTGKIEFRKVKNMVVRAPGILTLSMNRNLGPKLDYSVREIKGDLEEFKKFPQFFSFSLERKIKPRHRMLVEYGLKMPLSRMLKVNEGEFNARLFEMLLRMVEER